jgi:serine protease Do
MKSNLSLASICFAAGLAAPAAFAQPTAPTPPPPPAAGPRARAQVITQQQTPYLGISAIDISSDRAKALKLKEERGVEIVSVDEGSSAAKAGLKEGDVVLEFNGQHVEGWEQLKRLVSETPINREIKVGIWRNGAAQTLAATVGSRKDPRVAEGFVFPNAANGLPLKVDGPFLSMGPGIEMPQLRTFAQNRAIGIFGESLGQEQQLAEYFGVKSGILIRSVMAGSAAEKAGIKAGDVIIKIDDQAVASPNEITSALRASGAKRNFNVTVMRNKKEVTLNITLEAGTSVRGSLFDLNNAWVLQFPSDNGVIQGAEERAPKVIRQ